MMTAVNIFKLVVLFGVIQFAMADIDGKIILLNAEALPVLNQAMDYRPPREAEYGLIRFQDDTNQDTHIPYRLVTFEDQSPNKPIKFTDQEDYNNPVNSNHPTVETTPSQFVFQNEQSNDNQLENIPQKNRKKRRRRKPRVQLSQGYPPIPMYQGANYYNNLGYPGLTFRPPRRSPPESTWSTVLNALTSVTINDDHQCIPMLVCQAAARGLFGNSTLLQFTQLNSLLAAYGSISTSPIFIFGRAAILGMTAKNDPESCAPQYPLCPTDPQKLVFYLNNHRGGFFRFFSSAQHVPHQPQNVPNDILQQIVPQLHASFGQYGLYQAQPNKRPNLEPHVPYSGQQSQQNYGLHSIPAFQPALYYGHVNKNHEYIPQQTTVPHTIPGLQLNKRDRKSELNFSTNYDLDQEIIKRSHNHKHSSKHSRKKHKRQRKHKKRKGKKRKSHHHRASFHDDEERRSRFNGDKKSEENSNQFLSIDAKTFHIDPQRTIENNFESPMNLNDIKVSRRFRRSAYPKSWLQFENQNVPPGAPGVPTNAARTVPDLSFEKVVQATDYLAQKDDRHCILLLICENAARGGLNFSNSNTSALFSNNPMEILHQMSKFGEAALYGLDHRNATDEACHHKYPECPTDRAGLMKYMRFYKGGFFKFFRETNMNSIYNAVMQDISQSQTPQWGNNNANMMPHYNQMSHLYSNINSYSQPGQSQGNMYGNMYSQPSGIYGQFPAPPQKNVYNDNSNLYAPPLYNQYPSLHQKEINQMYAAPKYGSRLYNPNQVNYGHLFTPHRRKYFSDNDEKIEENNNVIQKRIQNFKPEVFVEDIRPNFENNNIWKFPKDMNVVYQGNNKIRGGRNVKFPSEVKDSVEGTQDFIFPGAQSHRQYNDFYNDLSSLDDNKSEEEDFEIVYVIRGNGDPSRPEIIRLRPGEKIM